MDSKEFLIGDRVKITDGGSAAHRRHHDNLAKVAASAPIPYTGAFADAVKETVFTFPGGGCEGEVIERRKRWFGQSGYDYLVKWDNCVGQSWHMSDHLLPTQ